MEPKRTRIDQLRSQIARLESGARLTPDAQADKHHALSQHLPQMQFGAVHDLVAQERDHGTLTGFAMAALAEALSHHDGTGLIVTTSETDREFGPLYGPGLNSFGIDPARLLIVCAAKPAEAIWALETALSCNALSVAIAEMRQHEPSLTAVRRLSLRAQHNDIATLLLRAGDSSLANGAATRWRVKPVAQTATGPPDQDSPRWQIGQPRFHVTLEKNRAGPPVHRLLEWSADERCLVPCPPLSGLLPADTVDRQGAADTKEPAAKPDTVLYPRFRRTG